MWWWREKVWIKARNQQTDRGKEMMADRWGSCRCCCCSFPAAIGWLMLLTLGGDYKAGISGSNQYYATDTLPIPLTHHSLEAHSH